MRRRTGLVLGMTFALGFVIGAMAQPALKARVVAAPAVAAVARSELPPEPPLARRLDSGLVYPAELVRIIDGDTFVARVRVWPGIDVDTKVRLRGIDAAELHARCAAELAKAQAARVALQAILSEGGITVWRIGIDKYGGRVDAAVATRNTADVSAAMLSGGWARAYNGGRRGSWCG
ncbi:MAG: thermonuclease family protein [Xanthobacteraceae bacterium]